MSKFIIKEIYIDKFNNTYDKLENFESGLNIICGDNEIGKSTMMSFIQKLFFNKTIDGSSYITCLDGKNEITLKMNSKEHEQYISKITGNNYKTGFIITLDDLMVAKEKDSEALIDIIKDSSGVTINNKQKEYEELISGKSNKPGYITTSHNKAGKKFKKLFDNLNEIDKDIKNLENKEEEYNSCCTNLKNIEEELAQKNKEYECAKISNEIFNINQEIDKIDLNTKLLDSSQEYQELTLLYSTLKYLKEEDKTKSKKESLEKDFDNTIKDLNKIADYDIEKIKEFDLNIENLRYAKQLIDERKELKTNNIDELINNITDNIQNKESELNELENKIKELKINDIEKYKEDFRFLNECISRYHEEDVKVKQSVISEHSNSDNYNVFLLTFGGLIMLGIALFILTHGISRLTSIPIIFASFGGIMHCIIAKKKKVIIQTNMILKELNNAIENLVKLANKYNIEVDKNNLILKSNCLFQTMNENINKYNSFSEDLKRINSELDNYKQQKNEKEKEKEEIKQKLEENFAKSKELLNNTFIDDIENYPDAYEFIKELQKNLEEQNKITQKENEIKEKTKDLSEKLNQFIDKTNIDVSKTNEFEFQNFGDILNEIKELIDKNIKTSQTKEDKLKEIQTKNDILNEKFSDIKDKFTDFKKEQLDELEKELKTIEETKSENFVKKTQLEEVEGLSDLKLKRNAEFNRIRKEINDLMVKEIILNIIKTSKEKFNEIQPNLINAKKYLSEITNGRYNDIDFENNLISGENTPQKHWSELSRGTKEQLYLALRLGFASNYSKNNDGTDNGIPDLPLLIDDAFVNFDKNRTEAILKCLEKFSKTNQVIFFTCHTNYVEDLLKSNKIKHNLIKL